MLKKKQDKTNLLRELPEGQSIKIALSEAKSFSFRRSILKKAEKIITKQRRYKNHLTITKLKGVSEAAIDWRETLLCLPEGEPLEVSALLESIARTWATKLKKEGINIDVKRLNNNLIITKVQ